MTTPDRHHDENPTTDAADTEHQELRAHHEEARSSLKGVEHTRTRSTYIALIAGVIILVLLLVFILQNLVSQRIHLLFWVVNLPVGVSLLIAAIAGALVIGAASGARLFQLRRAMRKARK